MKAWATLFAAITMLISNEAFACSLAPPQPPPLGETAAERSERLKLQQRLEDDRDRAWLFDSRVIYVGRLVHVRELRPHDRSRQSSVVVAPTEVVLYGQGAPERLRITDAYGAICGSRYAAVPAAEDVGREVLIALGDPSLGPDFVQEMVFTDTPAGQRLLRIVADTSLEAR